MTVHCSRCQNTFQSLYMLTLINHYEILTLVDHDKNDVHKDTLSIKQLKSSRIHISDVMHILSVLMQFVSFSFRDSSSLELIIFINKISVSYKKNKSSVQNGLYDCVQNCSYTQFSSSLSCFKTLFAISIGASTSFIPY